MPRIVNLDTKAIEFRCEDDAATIQELNRLRHENPTGRYKLVGMNYGGGDWFDGPRGPGTYSSWGSPADLLDGYAPN